MDKYGLIGYPLKHSFSNKFFTDKFTTEEIDAQHHNFEIDDIGLFSEIISTMPELRGLNVTIPYKEQVIPYLDVLHETAKMIGAVNVIRITRDGNKTHLIGYNSDLIGFQNSIKPLLNPELHKKALILGTGGASKAVKCGLMNLGLETKYVSRRSGIDMLTYDQLNRDIIDEYKVIVNTTPLGTFPKVDECPDIPYSFLTENHLLYDLVYNPPLTKFLEEGAKRGATIKNGAEMFELQAIASWEIWNDNL